jgi:hypothetical protein
VTVPRILIACVGNIFLGDDAFGGEVAPQLAHAVLPDGVEVRDFGIRGLDLRYALMESYEPSSSSVRRPAAARRARFTSSRWNLGRVPSGPEFRREVAGRPAQVCFRGSRVPSRRDGRRRAGLDWP